MTMMMTFSVYSLRVATDMPVESNFLPMVTLVFVFSTTYTFLSMIWFIIANEFVTKNNIPKCLIVFACGIKRVLFWKFNSKKDKKVDLKPEKIEVIITPQSDRLANVETINQLTKLLESLSKPPCYNCGFCEKCLEEKKSEKEKKKNKELNEENVSALNHSVFLCLR